MSLYIAPCRGGYGTPEGGGGGFWRKPRRCVSVGGNVRGMDESQVRPRMLSGTRTDGHRNVGMECGGIESCLATMHNTLNAYVEIVLVNRR